MASHRLSISLNWLEIQGTFGQFAAPGSESTFSYLLTHASLGSEGSGNTQLTKHLVPMRESFDIGDLNFDELMQRDLDDHRVASEIIPYLLRYSPAARFFPPILAVILPIEGNIALSQYPGKKLVEENEKNEKGEETGYIKETQKFDKVFEVDRFRDQNGDYAYDTRVRLNPDRARIVVLDGQHRAMAILAIRRSQTGNWGDRGADFKHFYEDIADELKKTDITKNLDNIELPVCLGFLPEICANGSASDTNLIMAFRKLFLDVNKEARKPTRARQLLLDDSNIISVLSRSILAAVRKEGKQKGRSSYSIDLDVFEYDSPRESPKPQRDLAICTIEMIYELVRWAVFAEDVYYTNLVKRPARGRSSPNKERFISEICADEKISSEEIRSWGFSNFEYELNTENVPSICHDRLSKLFMDSWGDHIIYILSNLHPFNAHINAVTKLRLNHRSETGHGQLAWRALFDGQGIYWTIKNYSEHRNQLKNEGQKLPDTDVETAYDVITSNWIPKEFEPNRAEFFWSKQMCSSNELSVSNRSFKVFRTMAFQIGFVMATASLKKSLGINDPSEFKSALVQWVSAWNTAFKFHPKSDGGSKSLSMFDPQGEGLMGRHFGRLQKSEWIWFRYFAFEMLESVSEKVEFRGKDNVKSYVNTLRFDYISKLGNKIKNDERKKGNEITNKVAFKSASDVWRKALKFSLNINNEDFDNWLKNKDATDHISYEEAESEEEYYEDDFEQ